jgi:diguanylate cyclase (GGDEF)-like protein
VLKENGAILVNAHSKPENLLEPWLGPETIDSLMNSNSPSLEYENERGDDVLGTLERVPQLNWIVIAEIPVAQAYSQIRDLRNQTALVVSLLLIGIGSIAYVLGASIARPLDRLIKGAGRVADGDLAVTISTGSKGELGYLTRVFNDMVERLRAGREELERISITDSLTGIYNRKYLNEKLADHVTYARDGDSTFTILMIDVDHFKAYNDTYGHVAGDKVLSRLGPLLKAQLRSSGFVARYGGEEFFALLPDADADDAVKVAERIRTAVADEPFGESGDKVRLTLSIGVATFENRGETSESIIAAADKALYRAKKNGRNRVTKARRKAAA